VAVARRHAELMDQNGSPQTPGQDQGLYGEHVRPSIEGRQSGVSQVARCASLRCAVMRVALSDPVTVDGAAVSSPYPPVIDARTSRRSALRAPPSPGAPAPQALPRARGLPSRSDGRHLGAGAFNLAAVPRGASLSAVPGALVRIAEAAAFVPLALVGFLVHPLSTGPGRVDVYSDGERLRGQYVPNNGTTPTLTARTPTTNPMRSTTRTSKVRRAVTCPTSPIRALVAMGRGCPFRGATRLRRRSEVGRNRGHRAQQPRGNCRGEDDHGATQQNQPHITTRRGPGGC
jgi:hypothetical protein